MSIDMARLRDLNPELADRVEEEFDKKRSWSVSYTITIEGQVVIEAPTDQEAMDIFESFSAEDILTERPGIGKFMPSFPDCSIYEVNEEE